MKCRICGEEIEEEFDVQEYWDKTGLDITLDILIED
ncbi:unnamed protein product, partial [marine sediment metagenome]